MQKTARGSLIYHVQVQKSIDKIRKTNWRYLDSSIGLHEILTGKWRAEANSALMTNLLSNFYLQVDFHGELR